MHDTLRICWLEPQAQSIISATLPVPKVHMNSQQKWQKCKSCGNDFLPAYHYNSGRYRRTCCGDCKYNKRHDASCTLKHNPANEPRGERPPRTLSPQTKAPAAKRMPKSCHKAGPSSSTSVSRVCLTPRRCSPSGLLHATPVPALVNATLLAERPRSRTRSPAAKKMPRRGQQCMPTQSHRSSYMHSSAGQSRTPPVSPVGFIPSSVLPQACQQGSSTHWHLPLDLPLVEDRLPQLMRAVDRANVVVISGGIHRNRADQAQKFWKLIGYVRDETCKIHLQFMYKMKRWGRSMNSSRLTATDPSVYAEVSSHPDFEDCLEEIKIAYYGMQESRNKKVVGISCKSGRHRSVGLAKRFCIDMNVEQRHLHFVQIDSAELTRDEVKGMFWANWNDVNEFA